MKRKPVLFQQRLPGLTLQGCKTKYLLLVSLQYKLYRTVTKIAYSIKENDGVPPLPPKGGSEARVTIYGSVHNLRMGRNFRLFPATMSVPPLGEEGLLYTNIITGFSTYFFSVCRKLAPTAPSTLR